MRKALELQASNVVQAKNKLPICIILTLAKTKHTLSGVFSRFTDTLSVVF